MTCGFRQEDFLMFSRKTCDSQVGKFGRDQQGVATYQISMLYAFQKDIFRFSLYKPM